MTRSSRNSSEGDVVALRADRLSKTFASTKALDEVSFEIEAGAVHALLGGNGCGKSTLIKILAGVHHGDPGGTVELLGAKYKSDGLSPAIAREAGLRFVHQDLGLFPSLSIAENLAHGRGFEHGKVKALSWSRQREHTKQLLERHRIDARPTDPLDVLRPAEQTMVAVARALQDDADTSLLVLDEPTASLDHGESQHLLEAMRRYAEAGQTIILVSHRIDEVMQVADAVTVLRDGRHVVTRSTEGLTEAELVERIVGRKLESFYPRAHRPAASKVVCKVEDLRGGPVDGVSFEVASGEILGLGGRVGSGRTELLRMMFGADRADAGTIEIEGRRIAPRAPSQAIRAGVAYVPEDRAAQAVFLSMAVRENLTMPSLRSYVSHGGRISKRRERARARELVSRYHVVTGTEQQELSSLSGGNQQKVVLGRWLSTGPKLLLLDEPTQGVDVGARADLYALIREAVDAGAAAIVVSSDLEELVHISDRVLVISRGRFRAELHTPIDSHNLTEMAHKDWQGEKTR